MRLFVPNGIVCGGIVIVALQLDKTAGCDVYVAPAPGEELISVTEPVGHDGLEDFKVICTGKGFARRAAEAEGTTVTVGVTGEAGNTVMVAVTAGVV